MAKSKKFKIDKKIRELMESYRRDITEEVNKAHMDAVIYGEGFLSIISTGGLKHIPTNKIIYIDNLKKYKKQKKVKKK